MEGKLILLQLKLWNHAIIRINNVIHILFQFFLCLDLTSCVTVTVCILGGFQINYLTVWGQLGAALKPSNNHHHSWRQKWFRNMCKVQFHLHYLS